MINCVTYSEALRNEKCVYTESLCQENAWVSGTEVLGIFKHQHQVEVKASRCVSESVSMIQKNLLSLPQIEIQILNCLAPSIGTMFT